MKRASSPSGDAPAGAGSAGARGGRATLKTALARLEWPWDIVHIEAETLTRDPYYCHPCQDAPTGAGPAGAESGDSGPATSSESQMFGLLGETMSLGDLSCQKGGKCSLKLG